MSAQQVIETAAQYVLPTPQRAGERRAFLACINDEGDVRKYHVTARNTRSSKGLVWEVDVEDWWVFARDYPVVGEATVDRPKALIKPGRS